MTSPEKKNKLFFKKEIKPITMRYFLLGIVGVFNFESGFLLTISSFLKKPKEAFEGFLGRDRYRYANPFRLAFIITAIAAFLSFQLNVFGEMNEGFDEITKGLNDATSSNEIQDAEVESALLYQFFKDYINVFLLGSVPVLSFFSFLFYRKRGYNYAQHLVLNTFIFAIITFIYIALIFFILIANWVFLLYLILSLAYTIYAYMSVLKGSVLRALACQLISYFVYSIIVVMAAGVFVGIKLAM